MAKMLVGRPGDDVGDQHLLREADDESAQAVGESLEADAAPGELVGDVVVPDDGPRDELREEEHVERGVSRALLSGGVVAVDVDDVRDRVEGEEGDADRQQHLGHGEGRCSPAAREAR